MPEKTQAELFNEELNVLLTKYPTLRLVVAHQIQVEEMKQVESIPDVVPEVPATQE